MTKQSDNSDKKVEGILDDAQVLLNFCENTFAKPSQAWFACLVSGAILTAELNVPLEKFLEGFEHAYNDAMKAKFNDAMGGKSYDH
jgi:hypothetical protein